MKQITEILVEVSSQRGIVRDGRFTEGIYANQNFSLLVEIQNPFDKTIELKDLTAVPPGGIHVLESRIGSKIDLQSDKQVQWSEVILKPKLFPFSITDARRLIDMFKTSEHRKPYEVKPGTVLAPGDSTAARFIMQAGDVSSGCYPLYLFIIYNMNETDHSAVTDFPFNVESDARKQIIDASVSSMLLTFIRHATTYLFPQLAFLRMPSDVLKVALSYAGILALAVLMSWGFREMGINLLGKKRGNRCRGLILGIVAALVFMVLSALGRSIEFN